MKKYNKVVMYIAFVIFFYTIIFLTIHNIEIQSSDDEKKLTIVEMQKINSQWITDTIEIPKNSKLMIIAYQGLYSLNYKKEKDHKKHQIRGGIIDFKIIRTIRKKE